MAATSKAPGRSQNLSMNFLSKSNKTVHHEAYKVWAISDRPLIRCPASSCYSL